MIIFFLYVVRGDVLWWYFFVFGGWCSWGSSMGVEFVWWCFWYSFVGGRYWWFSLSWYISLLYGSWSIFIFWSFFWFRLLMFRCSKWQRVLNNYRSLSYLDIFSIKILWKIELGFMYVIMIIYCIKLSDSFIFEF